MLRKRLEAGTAEIEIACDSNCTLSLDLTSHVAAGVRTPLMARCLALSNGTQGVPETLVLVTLDLFGLTTEAVAAIHTAVSDRNNIESHQIMLVCSHARGAPCTVPLPGVEHSEEVYALRLAEPVAELVARALAARQPAALGLGHAQLPHILYNHRLMTRNMKAVSAWLGVPRDEVLAPEGPIDPDFAVLVVRDANGFPICLVWNCAADNRFPEGDHLSAGLPYYVQQAVDERAARHIPCLYLPGCSGNVSFIHDLPRTTDLVASGVMAVQMETSCDPDMILAARSQHLILPVRDYSQFWSQADITLKEPGAVDHYPHEVDLLMEEGAHASAATVQVFQLGRFALVGMAGMPFVELALTIKDQSPFWGTVVAGNANAYLGPVPTRLAFDHGGMETWPARASRIGPGGGEFMVAQATGMLAELWKGRAQA